MINKAHIKIGDVIYGSSDSVDIIYDNTESGLESNNIQDAIDEIAAGVCFADGIVVNVEMANWIAQEDGTYTNTVAIEGILESEMYDVSLYGDSTEEQAHAFDFLVTDIDTYDGQIVLTASEEITVAFSVILRGKVNLENKNVYVSDLSATNIEYDNSESNMVATDIQNAIDELATSVKGIVIDVTTDSWDLQEDGTYKKVIAVEGLTGNEVLDTCLNPSVTHTEEQITAFSELVTSIETAEGRIILTASEAITVEFSLLLYGKVGFEVSVIENNNGGGSGNTNIVKLTQVEYDALGDEKLSDNNIYLITDADELTAKNMSFDDSETGLGVNNVQDAIIEQNKKFVNNYSHDECILLDNVNSPYIAEVDGLWSASLSTSSTRWGYASMVINGIRFANIQNNNGAGDFSVICSYHVNKGDVLEWVTGEGGTIVQNRLYPSI